jgi:GR25 family glycosyltransferase involved in LPS biosynthesis
VAFASEDRDDAIRRIYVINLDRKPDRWRQVSRELGRVRDRFGRPLSSITRRYSAVDARYMDGSPDARLLLPQYSLADQLRVEPDPRLSKENEARGRRIDMTPQEVAIALSHIAVWKLIAASRLPYTLVLEDDAYFRRGFARRMNAAWVELLQRCVEDGPSDLLYLSFKEARGGPPQRRSSSGSLRRPEGGLWWLSGYVLSRPGAQKLLSLLPARGPIDLWLNLQFGELDVLTTRRPLIDQRPDVRSTNSYSVLPILSQVGVLTREKPLLARDQGLPAPVFALGDRGSGLTALATALSMLGYRCVSDVSDLPESERTRLFEKKGDRVFTAYVNIGSLGSQELATLATLYRNARFIITTCEALEPHSPTRCGHDDRTELEAPGVDEASPRPSLVSLSTRAPGRVLVLPAQHPDKWDLLSTFLGWDYPSHPYPREQEQGQRQVVVRSTRSEVPPHFAQRLQFDPSPWIIPLRSWEGISVAPSREEPLITPRLEPTIRRGSQLDDDLWLLRDDTFPSNLALFRPDNVSIGRDDIASLTLREERTPVRAFTSGAIASRHAFLYGRFAAELRPSNVAGLITGVFLHRNGPRQEIDIEFLGKDTTKVLVNVYYNPGNDGSKLEFGYRGSPVLVDLGFDAATEFHRYEIEWQRHAIRWCVDGRLLHERVTWDPTPIPDLPMQLNVNLWHTRSKELAGRLDLGRLPARADIRAICVA